MADNNNLAQTVLTLEGISSGSASTAGPLANPSSLSTPAGDVIQLSEN